VTAFPVVTNISVGAGDSFNAGFLYGLWQNRTLEEALCFGSAVAALVVSGQQGVLSAPTVAEVDELVRVSSLAN
jgi:sugar/nucleoside kinase (ribokinase family)